MNSPTLWQETIMHLAIKAALLLAAALILGLALRRLSAARRYPLWAASVLGALILPLAVPFLPAWQVLPPLTPPTLKSTPVESGPEQPALSQETLPASHHTAVIDPAPAQPVMNAPASPAPVRTFSWAPFLQALPWVWLGGFLLLTARIAFSAGRLWRLTSRLKRHAGLPPSIAQETGLRKMPRLLLGPPDSVPMVWGVFRPHLLLPEGFQSWPADKLRAVLLHELAHLKRRDPLSLWTAQFMQALHWFNPLAWLTLRQLRADQERACDDTVLRHGIRPSDYAQHLLDLSRHRRLAPGLSLCALAMAGPAPVGERVTAILDTHRARQAATPRWTLLWVGLGLALALPLAMLQALEAAKVRGRILDRNGRVLAETKHDVRQYPGRTAAAHVLGYTGKSKTEPFIEGRLGLEKHAEAILKSGRDLHLTLDARLQSRAEQSLRNEVRNGAIVVIETATGEVLALASSPAYDPNLFSSGDTIQSYEKLLHDLRRPSLARAFQAEYPPGGIFRLVTAMSGMADGKQDAVFNCEGRTQIGGRVFNDSQDRPHGPLSLEEALVQGCNSYSYQMADHIGGGKLVAMASSVGFGSPTGLPGVRESSGHLPSMSKPGDAKMLAHPGSVANIAIGQGTVLATPLQLAVFTSIIANKGRSRAPALIADQPGASITGPELRPEDWETLRRSMKRIVNETSGHSAKSQACEIAVMTGTSQWKVSSKQDLATLVGFAPYDQPRIAFAIVVEGYPDEKLSGSLFAPMAKEIVERYLALPADGTDEVRPWQVIKAENEAFIRRSQDRIEKARTQLPPQIRDRLKPLPKSSPFEAGPMRKSIDVDWTPRLSPEI